MEYNNNNNYYNAQAAMGMGATPYMGAPYVTNNVPLPTYVSSLSDDEFKQIQNKPASKFDISISQEDNIIAICNHKHNGQDMVREVNDGTGDVYCPICNQRWSPHKIETEELMEHIQKVIDTMQNCKWVGDLNIQLVRDYFPLIPLLQKFPELNEQAMRQFSRYMTQNAYSDASDASVYYQYNSLMGRAPMPMMNPVYGGYPQGQAMMNQPYPYANQQAYQAPQGGYVPNPAMNAPVQQQNPVYTNPMQAPMNTQFTDQNQMMMQGQYYQPNVQQMAPQQYPYANQQAYQAQPVNMNAGQPAPQGGNYAPNYAPVGQVTAENVKADANNATVTKDTSIKID